VFVASLPWSDSFASLQPDGHLDDELIYHLRSTITEEDDVSTPWSNQPGFVPAARRWVTMAYEADVDGLHGRKLVLVFTGLMLVMLMAALDSTVVSTALPTIARLVPRTWTWSVPRSTCGRELVLFDLHVVVPLEVHAELLAHVEGPREAQSRISSDPVVGPCRPS
jgi:hypothetical protein